MPIILSCDAPGCTRSAPVSALRATGGIHPPAGWWIVGGRETTLVACCEAHTVLAQSRMVVAPRPAVAGASPLPVRELAG